jgi:hypothetical protein
VGDEIVSAANSDEVMMGAGFEVSEWSVSLVTEVGTVFVEARLMDRGLSVSGETDCAPSVRGELVGARWTSSGCRV